jgi:peroxiredoxin
MLETTAAPRTSIYYEDTGGDGQPVVLIHGWPLSLRMWEAQVNALADAGHRCIAYDRRGFGSSGRPQGGYDYDTFASDLNDLMTALDLRGATLAGFSMGGGEVVRYLARYGAARVSRAMLIAAVPPFLLRTPDNPEGVDRQLFDGMIEGVKRDRIGFLADFFPNFYNWEPGSDTVGEDVIAYSKSLAWPASPVGTRECIVAFGTTDFRRDLAKVTVPTLVVHGDADRIVPLPVSGQRSAEMIAGSRLEVIAGAPHGLSATHGLRLNELMLDFLRA